MYPINDRQYLKICAGIAKLMSISLSSAKKKVEIQIAKEGSKTIQEKIQVAQNVLKICEKNDGDKFCLLYTSPSPRDLSTSRMPSSA